MSEASIEVNMSREEESVRADEKLKTYLLFVSV